jgi:hypothetical protein
MRRLRPYYRRRRFAITRTPPLDGDCARLADRLRTVTALAAARRVRISAS